MAIDSLPTNLVNMINKEKEIKENTIPLSIQIDDDVIYFMTSEHPNKRFSLTKAQIRNIFSSL